MRVEEMGRYDPYTDKFIKNTTTDRIEVGTDGNLYELSISNGNEFLSKDKLYTKADMVAMLTEIQLEIDEKATELCDDGWWLTYNDIIQQKINALKENKDGSN